MLQAIIARCEEEMPVLRVAQPVQERYVRKLRIRASRFRSSRCPGRPWRSQSTRRPGCACSPWCARRTRGTRRTEAANSVNTA